MISILAYTKTEIALYTKNYKKMYKKMYKNNNNNNSKIKKIFNLIKKNNTIKEKIFLIKKEIY